MALSSLAWHCSHAASWCLGSLCLSVGGRWHIKAPVVGRIFCFSLPLHPRPCRSSLPDFHMGLGLLADLARRSHVLCPCRIPTSPCLHLAMATPWCLCSLFGYVHPHAPPLGVSASSRTRARSICDLYSIPPFLPFFDSDSSMWASPRARPQQTAPDRRSSGIGETK